MMATPVGLHIPQPIFLVMLAHLQATYPEEGCGLLAGVKGQATHLYAVENSLRSPVAYEMLPQQQLQAMLHLEDQGQRLLAIYHSHPAGPQAPSATDVARAMYPEAVHVIVSLQRRAWPVVRGFTIREGVVDEVRLHVAD